MKLAEFLSLRKISQADFASAIGATQASVSRYCGGRVPENKDMMLAIVRETGGLVTANDFFASEEAGCR